MEFKQGDVVAYGAHGACTVAFVGDVDMDRKKRAYYILEPCDNTQTKYYVPKDNALAVAKIQKLLSRSQLEGLLTAVVCMEDHWIADETERKAYYKKLLSSGNWEEILCMIRTVRHHKKEQLSGKKKFHICDENFLKAAEQLISSQVSQILNIPREEVGKYIQSRLADES